MKKVLLTTAVLFASSWLFTAPAYAGNGSFTLDGIYSRRLSGFLGHDNGLGASWLLEWQPAESLAIGVGMDAIYYFGVKTPNNFSLESINLVGRYIINPGNPWTFYVLAGGGFNPKFARPTSLLFWGGDFHIVSGPGVWFFLSPQTALDLGLIFNYYSNTAPLEAIKTLNVRAGLSFFFEKPEKPVSPPPQTAPAPSVQTEARLLGVPISKQEIDTALQASAAVIATPTAVAPTSVSTTMVSIPTPTPQTEAAVSRTQDSDSGMETSHELSFKGHSLWDTAARVDIYGDPGLYPLLVDANREALKPKQFVLDPDTQLVVPRNPTQEMIDKARKDAWTPQYQKFSGRRLTPEGYQRWREAHPVPLISKE